MPEASFLLPLVWQSALLPFVVALAVLAVGRAMSLHVSGAVIAVAAGFIASYLAFLHAQWSPVPRVAMDWLPWIALVGAAGALGVQRLGRARTRAGTRLVIAMAAGALLVGPAIGSIGVRNAAATVLAMGLVTTLAWTLAARGRPAGTVRPLLLAVVAGGAGLALMVDSSQSIGRLSGALAAALLACVLFSVPRRGQAFSPAATGLALLLIASLLTSAHVYAGFPLAYVALLAGALLAEPLFGMLGRNAQPKVGSGLRWVGAVCTVTPVAATLVLALKAMQDAGGY